MLCVAISFLLVTAAAGRNCPTWHYLLKSNCVCGSTLNDVVVCNSTTGEVGVLVDYCLTSDGDESVVGRCLAEDVHRKRLLGSLGSYSEVFSNLSEQDSNTCGFLNRRGRLCGQCKPSTSIHAYTYDMKCYPCPSNIKMEVFKYIGIAYIPLTIFLIVVVVFHISVTSPTMNVPVLCCQLLSLPFALRFIWQYALVYPKLRLFVQIFGTLYGIWNLDFFRLVIHPICLQLDVIKLIALDYLVAVYPLLLLVCFYVLVTAHDRGCRLVVKLSRPFLWCSARIRQQQNAKHSIIDAFVTFLLLSYIKFLNTSIDLLVTSYAYNVHGKSTGRYLFNNPTVEFMSHQHVPYAIISIAVLVGLFVPLVLLILYPMKWFQVLLNKCHLNSPGLRMFMECFQGYYRDRTDGGWECRYFAVVYPATRILTYFTYAIFEGLRFYVGCITLCISVIGVIVLVQPYKLKYKFYNKFDIFMLFSPLLLLIGLIISYQGNADILALTFVCFGTLIPTVYFTIKGLLSLTSVVCKFRKNSNNPNLYMTLKNH